MNDPIEAPRYTFSQFILRLIAIVTMTLDHVGLFLLMYYPNGTASKVGVVFRAIGRLAMPLFLMMLAEGMRHTRNKWKYMARVGGIYLIISLFETIMIYAFPNELISPDAFDPEPFADLFFNGMVLLCLSLPGKKKLFALLPFSVLALSFACGVYDHFHPENIILWFPRYLRAAYSLFGTALAVGFFYAPAIGKKMLANQARQMGMSEEILPESWMYQKTVNMLNSLVVFLVILLFWGLSYVTAGREISPETDMSLETWALLDCLVLMLYNGRRGHNSKPFRIISYLYFPVHLILIWLIFYLI